MRTSRVQHSSRRIVGRWGAAGLLVLGAVVALAVMPAAAGAATAPRTTRVVSTAQIARFGTILVAGNTVYTLRPSRTACTATCSKTWLPVLLPHGVATATAGTGVDASKLGTASAAHHAHQVTYGGKRLYWFAKDTAPGQVRGVMTNKWGKWSTVAVAVSAAPTTVPPTEAPTTAPATEAPATAPPATAPPATEAPATEPPATEPPPTSPPATKPPATTSPGTGGVAF